MGIFEDFAWLFERTGRGSYPPGRVISGRHNVAGRGTT